MGEELKFPIEFKECPNCGSTRRIAQTIIDEQIEKGLAGEDTQGFATISSAVLWDQRKSLLAIPVLTCFEDVCLDCGTKYCVKAIKGQGHPQMKGQMGASKGPLFPPGMPYGKG